MANKANKYATIVDALEYGYKTDRQHSQDINIIHADRPALFRQARQ